MRTLAFLLIIWVLGLWGCNQGDIPQRPLASSQDSLSYAIGMFLGQSYQTQRVDIDPSLVYQGLRDYLYTDTLALSDSLAQMLIARTEKRLVEDRERQLREKATAEASRTQVFLDSNRQALGVVELSSGLQYRVLEEGLGTSPLLKSQVRISYAGALIGGETFDQSVDGSVIVTVEDMIPGLTQALTYMKPGARWRIFVPPHLGYGKQGRPPSVPPNAVLIFDLRLLEVLR